VKKRKSWCCVNFWDEISDVMDNKTSKTFIELVLAKKPYYYIKSLIRVVRKVYGFDAQFAKNLIWDNYNIMFDYYKNNSSEQNCTVDILC